jgi:hypothetical protein
MTLTVPNITRNITVAASGADVPVYKFAFNGDPLPTPPNQPLPPPGLTYHATPVNPIEHREFTVTFEPRADYLLPGSLAIEMGGQPLTSFNYTRSVNSEGKPIGVLKITSVTGDLDISIEGEKISSYTLIMSHLTATVAPMVDESSSLVITFHEAAGSSLPGSVTVERALSPAVPAFTYNSTTGVLTIPNFAKVGVFPAYDYLKITANGV